jgi:hypothetical protein
VVSASGLLVDARTIGAAEMRRRVLADWVPGTQVHRLHDDVWVVRWPSARRVRCERAPGLPLVETGTGLVGLPVAAGAAPARGLARMVHGALAVDALSADSLHDPSLWLDVSDFTVAAVQPIGPAPAGAPKVDMAAPATFDPRAKLSGIPAASEAQQRLLAALVARGPASGREGSGAASSSSRAFTAILGRVARLAHALVERVRSAAAGRTSAKGPAAPTRQGAPRQSWLARMTERVAAAFSRAVWTSRLGQILGRQHAEHLQRMMDMFERGDTDEALRHAIPLGTEVAEGLRRLPLGVPSPRTSLDIHLGLVPAAGLGLGQDLYSQLQAMYRAAFRRLEAQGRIDEAAFVLAELLQAHEEAVAFLEKHGRLRFAAEIAEARDLAPGLVVRQWFIAGDRERALRIAAERGAFADAIVRLEKQGTRDDVVVLRLLWGNALADAGDYIAAVNAVWPLPEASRIALAWIDRALATESPAATALLTRKLERCPERFPEIRDTAVRVLEADDAEGVQRRLLLAGALADMPPAAGLPPLARAAARSVVRDAGLYRRAGYAGVLRKLVQQAGDGALRTDLPRIDTRPEPPLATWSRPFEMTVDAAHVGTGPVLDAVFLSSGRMLVARGEAGAFLLSRQGRTMAHFDVPVHALVISDHEDRAIGVAYRGEMRRLYRLDLVSQRAEVWCDTDIVAFAPDYDGRRWFVANTDLYAIDVTRPRFEATWHVSDVTPVPVGLQIARSDSRLCVFVPLPERQVWMYELPRLILRERREVARPNESRAATPAISKTGLLLEHASDELGALEVRWETGRDERPSIGLIEEDSGEAAGPLAVDGDWAAVSVRGRERMRVVLLDAREMRPRAVLRLDRTRDVRLRFGAGKLTIADDLGRLLVLDLHEGWLIRDLRL